ncbi:hypothetical protein AGMMS49942_23190 [Spirochaetia bacterium]|nr:hypothetical protein AGMMS49942_23190 [Spirochaetia bacterium]
MVKKGFYIIFFLLTTSGGLFGQAGKILSFEFIDQNISDILYSFSTYAKISIIADDTVSGTASFQYNGTNFESAFDSFLLANRLYVEKTPDLWLVTRIAIVLGDGGTIILDALDASPMQLLEKLSRKTGATIIRDILPATRLSLHLATAGAGEAVELIMKPYTDYTVETTDTYIQVKKAPVDTSGLYLPQTASGSISIRESGGIYEVAIEKARLGDVPEQLFGTARREYVSFVRPDQVIERVGFSGKVFSESLSMILEQGNGESNEINNISYIFPVQQTETIKRLKDEGKSWRRFELKHLSISEFRTFMQSRFPDVQTISPSDSMYFFSFVNAATAIELQNNIRTIDVPKRSAPITLKYIRTEDLFKALPPSVKREELVDTGNGNTLFFVGTPERLALFREDLAIIDRPRLRIRYDLFIMQVEDSSTLNWAISAEAREMQLGDKTMITGQLGNLFNLNFDIITLFGYQFAAKVNAAIKENQASVFADTTLYGLSGEEIKFQNTSTYRYRDSNIDPDTGKPIYSGVTREIVSGLMLDINGWVSGDGMITTTITASVSKRGADVSSSIGNPPPTSERVLTTQVRCRSGEPVILSGLKQNDKTIVEERVPVISKIPILGWLFRNRNTQKENTQMIIYLVPHVDLSSDEYTVEGLKTASIYKRFVVPFLETR